MKRSETITAAFVAALIIASGIIGVWSQNQPQAAAAQPAFDHSMCQYPDRWTNPPDSCDNSDPAVPECIKAAFSQQSEADCIAYYVAQHQAPTTPIVEQPKPAQPTEAVQCGGK